VRRPRPIRRLVDGRSSDSGKTISRRLTLLMVPAVAGANAAGATVVFVLAGYIVPTPEVEDNTRVLLINLLALGVFGLFAIPTGVVLGYRQMRSARSWLLAEREPDARDRRRVLRAPLRQLLVTGALWLLAVVLFAGLNACSRSSSRSWWRSPS
jgi:adenylate cyclase